MTFTSRRKLPTTALTNDQVILGAETFSAPFFNTYVIFKGFAFLWGRKAKKYNVKRLKNVSYWNMG